MNNALKPPKSYNFRLALIIAAGLALRLMAACLQPAFYDEGHTYNFTKQNPGAIMAEMRRDSHPPVFNLLLYPLVHGSNSIFILRLPCVLAGTFAIWLGFRLGCRFGRERCGLLLAAIMACTYNVWLLDAQLRSYGILDCVLLALLLMVLNIYASGTPTPFACSSRTNWIIFAAAALTAASLHVTGTVTVLCCLILLAALPRLHSEPPRRLPCTLLAVSLLPPLGWFIYIKLQAQNFLSQAHALNTNFREYLDVPAYLLGWQVYPFYILDLQRHLQNCPGLCSTLSTWLAGHINPIYGIFIILAWYLLIKGACSAFKHNRQEAAAVLCPPLVLAAMLITANICHAQVLQKRHLLPLCPALLLCISLAVSELSNSKLRRLLLITILGSSLITAVLFPFNTRLWNQHWQTAINYIEKHRSQKDLILVYHGGACYSFAQAYAPGKILYKTGIGKISLAPDYSGPLILPLTPSLASPAFLDEIKDYRLFLVLNQYRSENARDHLYDWVMNNFDIEDSFHEDSYTDWAVVDVCRLKPKQPAKPPL